MTIKRGNDLSIGRIAETNCSLQLPRDSRDKHLYVCGATGTGKSKFLEHLIWQDIQNWYKSECGMLLIDPHGSLFDSLINRLTSKGPSCLPIIPIDLRQNDWVVSYNALRKREVGDCQVVVDSFVQAMAHVWGQAGTDQTPRFAKWASSILRTLYENEMTLLEAEYLIDYTAKDARRSLMRNLRDKASLQDWNLANELRPNEFEAQLGSTTNRLRRFLRNSRMRSIFGHSRVSLDLGKALEEGHIILVSAATAGACVSKEDADLFATLLLSDLWTAASERGKMDNVKPFYLYLDEFQRFVTPTIAENLDESRGFGLHVTMANQFPQQLLDQGDHGKRLFHSVMENANSKVVFRLHTEDNLKPLAQWLFRGAMNPDEIKHTLEATRVLGYEEVERISRTTGRSKSSGHSESTGTSKGSGSTLSYSDTWDDDIRRTDSDSSSEHEGSSTSEATTESSSETVGTSLIPVLGKEVSHVQFRSLEEQLHKAMAVLFDQKKRECVARLVGMEAPVSICTPNVPDRPMKDEWVKAYSAELLERWDFALPADEAAKELADREKGIEAKLREPNSGMEPENYRRPVDP
jgi:hypothetical protein